jgi:hypothetical protein
MKYIIKWGAKRERQREREIVMYKKKREKEREVTIYK